MSACPTQLLWVDTIEVAWVTFLSIVANEKKKATEEVILNETQAETVQAIEEQLDTRSEEMIVEAQGAWRPLLMHARGGG